MTLKTAQQQVNLTWLREQRLQIWMQSMTQYMKWRVTKQDTAKHSWVCITDTSNNQNTKNQRTGEIPSFLWYNTHGFVRGLAAYSVYPLFSQQILKFAGRACSYHALFAGEENICFAAVLFPCKQGMVQ